jgi:hypothetical protein
MEAHPAAADRRVRPPEAFGAAKVGQAAVDADAGASADQQRVSVGDDGRGGVDGCGVHGQSVQ